MQAQRWSGGAGRSTQSNRSRRWRGVALAVAVSAVGAVGGLGCGDTTDAATPTDEPAAATASPTWPSTTSTAPVPAPGASPAAPGGPPPCPPSGLVVTQGVQDGALGRRFTTLLLTNCGSTSHEVNGYPEVTLLDAEQQPLDVAVIQGTDFVEASGPQPLGLAPGDSVLAGMTWRNLVEGGTPVTSTFIAVAAVPGDAPQVMAMAVDPGTSGEVEITAWQPIPPPWSQ